MTSDDEIKLKLSLTGAQAFKRDADRAATSIRNIGKAAKWADRYVDQLANSLNRARGGMAGYTAATRQAEAAVRAMEQRVRRLRMELEQARHAQNRLGNQTRNSSSNFNLFGSTVSRVAGVAGGALRGILSTITAITAATAAGTAAFVTYGLKAAGTMEQRQIGFQTILGGEQIGNEFLDQVNAFAARTPLDTQQVAAQAQFLMGTGTPQEKVLPTINALGDAVSALNLGEDGLAGIVLALQQMRLKTTLSAEEINQQLAERGIPAWKYLAEASGRSEGKVMKDAAAGKVSGAQASDVVLAGIAKDPKFAGAMEKQGKTFLGMISNLHDTFWIESAKAFRPLTDELAKHLPWVVEKLGKGMSWVGRLLADKVVPNVRLFANAFKDGGFDLVIQQLDGKMGLGGKLSDLWTQLKRFGKAWGTYFVDILLPLFGRILQLWLPRITYFFDKLAGVIEFGNRHKDQILWILGKVFDIAEKMDSIFMSIFDFIGRIVDVVPGWVKNLFGGGNGVDVTGLGGAAGAAQSQAPNIITDSSVLGPGGNPFAPNTASGFPGMATGGTVTRSGMSWVGELGPELLSLPAGATVRPLEQSGGSSVPMGNIVLHPGAIQVSGWSSAEADKLGKIVIDQIKTKIARQ